MYPSLTGLGYGALVVRVMVRDREYNEANQYDTGDHGTQETADKPGGTFLFLLCGMSDAKDIDKDPGYELNRIHAGVCCCRFFE